MDEPTQQPNENVTPPGSSESFNDFKTRILGTMTGYMADNDNQNTVMVTHSKPIGVFNGWEHSGYPEDGSVHLGAYEEGRCKQPGGHEEVSLPGHILQGIKDFKSYLENEVYTPESYERTKNFGWYKKGNPLGFGMDLADAALGTVKDLGKEAIENPTQLATDIVGPGELGMVKTGDQLFFKRMMKKGPANENISEDAGHPLEFLLNWLQPKKDAFEEAVKKQKSTPENTWVGADRNKYPNSYKIKDEDVPKELGNIYSFLGEQSEHWTAGGYPADMFEKEFDQTYKRKAELEQRLEDMISARGGQPTPSQPQQGKKTIEDKRIEDVRSKGGGRERLALGVRKAVEPLLEQGLSYEEIADKTGYTAAAIEYIANTPGKSGNPASIEEINQKLIANKKPEDTSLPVLSPLRGFAGWKNRAERHTDETLANQEQIVSGWVTDPKTGDMVRTSISPTEKPKSTVSELAAEVGRKGASVKNAKYSQWSNNPELETKLTALRDKGLSVNEIAKEMGMTKNTIIGKLDRMKKAEKELKGSFLMDQDEFDDIWRKAVSRPAEDTRPIKLKE